MQTIFKKLPDVPDDQQIEKWQSEDNIPTGQDVLSKMVQPEGFKALDAVGKAAVVKLFANLQSALPTWPVQSWTWERS